MYATMQEKKSIHVNQHAKNVHWPLFLNILLGSHFENALSPLCKILFDCLVVLTVVYSRLGTIK